MPKFRKRPVVIEARQFTGSLGSYLDVCDWMKASGSTAGGTKYVDPCMVIPTLEGDHTASPGDWIIRGVKGEFYPCKPEIFAATYEPVEAPMTDKLPDAETLSVAQVEAWRREFDGGNDPQHAPLRELRAIQTIVVTRAACDALAAALQDVLRMRPKSVSNARALLARMGYGGDRK